jgi:GH24 family phage-related lysozyme (muramidase)
MRLRGFSLLRQVWLDAHPARHLSVLLRHWMPPTSGSPRISCDKSVRFDKIPVSTFDADQAQSVGELAKNRFVTVHEEILGGGKSWSRISTQENPPAIKNSLRDLVSQFYAAAILARGTIDGLREAIGEFPTVAQLRFAWVPPIGLKGAAQMLAKSEAKIDAALADVLKPADAAAVTAILDSDPEIFREAGQPRTVAQAIDALGVRLNNSLAPTGKLIDAFFKAHPDEDPSSVAASDIEISEDAIKLIIEHEVSSQKVYDKKYRGAIWPGLQSGVTVGIGYDVGWQSVETVKQDFADILDPAELAALLGAVGKKGGAAQAHLAQLRGKIDISYDDALKVFRRRTIPVWTAVVEKNLENTGALNGHSLGALVSLVYNRGPLGFKSARPRFRHMREIARLMAAPDFKAIPKQFRDMKVIWQGKGVPGLLRRREEEAVLFEKGLQT